MKLFFHPLKRDNLSRQAGSETRVAFKIAIIESSQTYTKLE